MRHIGSNYHSPEAWLKCWLSLFENRQTWWKLQLTWRHPKLRPLIEALQDVPDLLQTERYLPIFWFPYMCTCLHKSWAFAIFWLDKQRSVPKSPCVCYILPLMKSFVPIERLGNAKSDDPWKMSTVCTRIGGKCCDWGLWCWSLLAFYNPIFTTWYASRHKLENFLLTEQASSRLSLSSMRSSTFADIANHWTSGLRPLILYSFLMMGFENAGSNWASWQGSCLVERKSSETVGASRALQIWGCSHCSKSS